MEQQSSSSKVTVEYFDPFGIYQLLSPGLLPRLPLRNLHWESHAGPLRSIQSLHIDLVPSAESEPLWSASPYSAGPSDLSKFKSLESSVGSDNGFQTQSFGKSSADKERPDSRSGSLKTPVRERRHQIPGLRQTPYLRVYFLRCDDNENYKAHTRKLVREWIKEHAVPTQSSSKTSEQENHDACEWLIVHVVVPNTAAATQPRTSAKGSSTILEKLRADFNGTSKSVVDRVAQIRIGINDVPYDVLPRVIPAIPGSYIETPQEHEEAWSDLISKFKELILASFDMRVSQYEEDIREKDAQRTLPGWNFCTFFVLKEGLARGFESVGLVEDALVGYDELAVGLDAIIREQVVAGSGAEHGGSFLPFTDDLRSQVEKCKLAMLKETGLAGDTVTPIDLQHKQEAQAYDQDEIPLSANRKHYRELILANNISIFDFRCYLFARQLSLLLRMGNAWSSREGLLAKLKEQRETSLLGVAARQSPPQPTEDTENLPVLAEICRRALEFVASISRIMREDLLASDNDMGHQSSLKARQDPPETAMDLFVTQVINNMVSSFTFSVAQQILAQTSTKSLPIPPSILTPPSARLSLHGQEPKATIPEPKTMMHPARSSSLAVGSREPPSPGISPGPRGATQDQITIPNSKSAFLKTGLEDLAAHRAELYSLSRSVLEGLGDERGWHVGWNTVGGHPIKMEDIELSEEGSKGEGSQQVGKVTPTLDGIDSKLLRTALDHQDDFYRLYETLTDKALRHYTVANRVQSVQSNIADLALLKFYLRDYAAAASYFYPMTPFYGEGGWEGIELRMLLMYAKSLKELKRNEEYVRVVLKLLTKGIALEKERLFRRPALAPGGANIFDNGDYISVHGYVKELMTVIPLLNHTITAPLQSFFASAEVEGNVRYHEDRDSFALQLRLRYIPADDLNIDCAKVRMVPISGGQSRDLLLETDGPVRLKKGFVKMQLQSNVIIPGTYTVTQVILQADKLVLSYETEATTQPPNGGRKFFKCPRILLYRHPDAFDVKLFASRAMHLDHNRSLEIELSSGWNDVLAGELHIRAGTAGLRLQTSEVSPIDGDFEILKQPEAGIIRFGPFHEQSKVQIRLPYSLEHDVNDISVRLEISYNTSDGTFFYATNPSISTTLPLGVNVQDVFKHTALFSKFTISSATSSPLRLLSSKLDDSDLFEARNGGSLHSPVVIFPRQPASLLYRITRRPTPLAHSGSRKKQKPSLSLTLHYICLDEEIDQAVDSALSVALRDSPFHQYKRLIVPTVLTQLRSNISANDLERTGLLGELPVSILSGLQWQGHFAGLGRGSDDQNISDLIAQWIHAWCERTHIITLNPIITNSETITKSRSIIIPVDVPSITVVLTADIRPLNKPTNSDVVAISNQLIPASLQIKWTRIWDMSARPPKQWPVKAADATPELSQDMEFVYEVTAATDIWLIGGKWKGHFKIPSLKDPAQSEFLEFPILLVPIKEGYLPYPYLEIKPTPIAKPATVDGQIGSSAQAPSSEEAERNDAVTCETDYKNTGEVIRVINNARKTTVNLDASGPQGGVWLLESETRGNEGDVFVG